MTNAADSEDDDDWIDDADPSVPQWWWCLHCERVNYGKRPDECTHGDCDGDWMDMWSWGYVRKGIGDGDYPLTPNQAMVYPLYPDGPGDARVPYLAGEPRG